MQGFQNCKRCGKLFESNGFSVLCPTCWKFDEYDFQKIKEYLTLHPGAKIFEVSNNLDISVAKIKRYLRESRLEIIDFKNLFLFCDKCGKCIRTGKYCDECYRTSQSSVSVAYTEKQDTKHSGKVNFRSGYSSIR